MCVGRSCPPLFLILDVEARVTRGRHCRDLLYLFCDSTAVACLNVYSERTPDNSRYVLYGFHQHMQANLFAIRISKRSSQARASSCDTAKSGLFKNPRTACIPPVCQDKQRRVEMH